ncbi:MAG: glycosyltransferase family 2 protein [Phycisphaerales bacterium]|nr:glycosyltransferase family 2 protein [Phycisphaerales bacterium]
MTDLGRKELAVIVLNYRTPGLVLDCLETLEPEVAGVDGFEVVVVDNCSGDDSAGLIEHGIVDRGWEGWARVVRSAVNGGFAAGNNVGIQASDAEMYLLLNSDTLVRPGGIGAMVDTMREHDDLHMLGARLEWPDGQYQVSTFRYRTPISELISGSQLGTIGRALPGHVVARELHEFTVGIDWVSFACVLIRREVIDRVGLLDERYFMYFEDMAYCRRVTKDGMRIGYQPAAHVVHLRGGSSPVKDQTLLRKRRPGYFYAARAHYFRDFYGLAGFAVANVLWTIGWVLGSLRGRSGAVAKQYRDIWCSPKHGVEIGGSDDES